MSKFIMTVSELMIIVIVILVWMTGEYAADL